MTSKRKALKHAGQLGESLEKDKKIKAVVLTEVEHPIRVIKRQFIFMKTRYRGLKKNAAQIATLFELSNWWMVRWDSMAVQASVGC